jgi:hypothetical protein
MKHILSTVAALALITAAGSALAQTQNSSMNNGTTTPPAATSTAPTQGTSMDNNKPQSTMKSDNMGMAAPSAQTDAANTTAPHNAQTASEMPDKQEMEAKHMAMHQSRQRAEDAKEAKITDQLNRDELAKGDQKSPSNS